MRTQLAARRLVPASARLAELAWSARSPAGPKQSRAGRSGPARSDGLEAPMSWASQTGEPGRTTEQEAPADGQTCAALWLRPLSSRNALCAALPSLLLAGPEAHAGSEDAGGACGPAPAAGPCRETAAGPPGPHGHTVCRAEVHGLRRWLGQGRTGGLDPFNLCLRPPGSQLRTGLPAGGMPLQNPTVAQPLPRCEGPGH